MTIDDKLNGQVRAALEGVGAVSEVKMFGGVGFMLNGNMVVAASDRGLLARVGPDAQAKALTRRGAQLMVMGGREMTGFIRVEPAALDARSVKAWVGLARSFVETLPAKAAKSSAKKTPTKARPKKATKPSKSRGRS